MLSRIALTTALIIGAVSAAAAADVAENKIGDIYPVPSYVTQYRASAADAFAWQRPSRNVIVTQSSHLDRHGFNGW